MVMFVVRWSFGGEEENLEKKRGGASGEIPRNIKAEPSGGFDDCSDFAYIDLLDTLSF